MTTTGMRMSAALSVAMMLLAAGSGVARAQGAAAKDEARSAMREGNALLEHGHAEEALAKFSEAYRLFPSPKLHYNLGQAHSHLPGHEAQAYEELSRFLNEANDANPSLRAAAELQRGQLRSKVGLLTIAADPPDADLVVDGVNVGPPRREAPVPLSVGTHKLTLTKGGAVSPPELVTVASGAALDVRLRLPAPTASRATRVAPPPPAPEPAETTSSPVLVGAPSDNAPDSSEAPFYRKAWFWGVVAGAVVAAAVGGFVLLRASPSYPSPTLGSQPAD